MTKIVILRGLPGSGKSTLIEDMNLQDKEVCSADHFFTDADGNYNYDPKNQGLAHQACYRKFIKLLLIDEYDGVIFVDNTNITNAEMAPYIQLTQTMKPDHEIYIVRMMTDLATCVARQTHDVPDWKIGQMSARFEDPLPYWPKEYFNHYGPEKVKEFIGC